MNNGTGGATERSGSLGGLYARNPMSGLGVAVGAFTPQIIYLAYAIFVALFGGLIGYRGASPLGPAAQFVVDGTVFLLFTVPLICVAIFTVFARIRGPQDYYGGVVLLGIALFAFWASWDLPGMRGFSFGPGTAPRMFSVLLIVLGVGIASVGLIWDGNPLAKYAVRGPLFVTLSILTFAVAIRPLGLIISAFASFMVAALGSAETRWKEALIVGVVITAFCCFLFPYALGLPFQLKPRFLQ